MKSPSKTTGSGDSGRCVATQVKELDRWLQTLAFVDADEGDKFKAKFAVLKQDAEAANAAMLDLELGFEAATRYFCSEPEDPSGSSIPA